MRTFKFFQKVEEPDVLNIELRTRNVGRTLESQITRDVAVIASSITDFRNWRDDTFAVGSYFTITNRDFIHTNGNTGVTTRYTAVLTVNQSRGLTFDDHIVTDRITDIISSVYDDTITHIYEIINEVIRNRRR